MIAVGQTIGNYTLTAKLGEGGMGVVYLAEHPVIGRKVAMKAIHPELLRNPEVVSRFVTEAKAVNQIGNEHILDIHDFGTTADGEFYFVMELLQGEALSDLAKRVAPFAPARALAIAAQVADALSASHQRGIIHRDLKPENIFIINKGHTPDFVKVLDFGLAKLTLGEGKATHKTRTGSVMGTPYYMAPEQCEGKQSIDHRADIYSLGVILFEMLTAMLPFSGEGYGEIIVKHITAPVPSARLINPMVTPAIEAILMRALAKPREQRFRSMEEMAQAMANPERYAEHASELPDLRPAASEPGPDSSRIALPLTGANPASAPMHQRTAGDFGAISAPMPSTFRHSTGELLEGRRTQPVSRGRGTRRLAVLIVAFTAAVAFAGYSFTRRQSHKLPASTAAPPAPSSPVPEPRKIHLALKSDPPGATVLREDTNEELGITPFDLQLATSTTPIALRFKKPSFRDKSESFIPAESGQLEVSLILAAPAEAPNGAVHPPATATRPSPKPASAVRHKPGASPRRRSTDEDGVLAPSF